MKWKYTIVETSVFYVDIDTTDAETAYDTIRDMLLTGEIDSMNPDEYDQTENAEQA